MPLTLSKRKKEVTPRGIYRRFKRAVRDQLKKFGAFDFEGLSRLILRSYRLLEKYTLDVIRCANLIGAFVMLFATERVQSFLETNPDWIRSALTLTGALVSVSLITL